MNRLRFLALTTLVLAATALAAPLRAQDYPTRPVTTVVPFAPGGAGDILSRMLSQRLEQRLGKPFLVENKPGGGGVVGVLTAAKSNPDGYTLLMSPSGPLAVNPTLMKDLPYNSINDFTPLALVAGTPFMLIVNPSLPVHTLDDLIKYQKQKGGPLPFAMVGPGTPHHLFAEMLKGMTGIEITYVPYKGSQPAITDLVAGHVPVMFCDMGPAGPQIAAGKVRALGVSTAKRSGNMPDIPSVSEAGVPGYEAVQWYGFLAPAGTPGAILTRIHAEAVKALHSTEMKEKLAHDGAEPVGSSSEAFAAHIRNELDKWRRVAKAAGIEPQ